MTIGQNDETKTNKSQIIFVRNAWYFDKMPEATNYVNRCPHLSISVRPYCHHQLRSPSIRTEQQLYFFQFLEWSRALEQIVAEQQQL